MFMEESRGPFRLHTVIQVLGAEQETVHNRLTSQKLRVG